MKSMTSRIGFSVAGAAALMSAVFGVLIPYGQPWPTVTFAIVALAAAVWMGLASIRLTPRMTDVIGTVEAESPRTSVATKPGAVS
jgi:hypothetical protein